MTDRRVLGGYFFAAAVLMTGLPPLSGFIGKFLTLQAALPHAAMPWIVGIILTTSLLGVIALARSGSVLFYRGQAAEPAHGVQTTSLPRELLPLTGLIVLCVLMVFWAGPIHEYALATAEQLLEPAAYIGAVLGPADAGGLQ
jgi:multicomponent K+:H+ antiporter subunit D